MNTNKIALMKELKDRISEKSQNFKQEICVFDADGTLWAEDINHIFIDYLIKNKLKAIDDIKNDKYQNDDIRWKRCQKIACQQAGFSIEEFRDHCRKALKETSLKIFGFQIELLDFLKNKGYEIYVVSASLKWLVKEACLMFKLPVDHVFGFETEIENKIITDRIIKPLTYGEGKKTKLLQEIKNKDCLFSSGNTMNDLQLLNMSKVQLVVNSAPKEHENFDSEQKLKEYGKSKSWFFLNQA